MHARTACGGPAHSVTRPSVQDDSVTGDPADSLTRETTHSVTRPPRDDSVTGQLAHSVTPISVQDESVTGDPADSVTRETAHSVTRTLREDSVTGQLGVVIFALVYIAVDVLHVCVIFLWFLIQKCVCFAMFA